jgi:cell division septation protein DedD
MEIQVCIAELLSEYDCVIVPGLGGFIGSYIPAQIHPVYHTFQPPSKKILFNINLRQNDGLLVNFIARVQKISFQEAYVQVNRFSETILQSLKSRKYIMLKNIGKLYMGIEGNIQFEQDLRTNHLADSFGLQPFFSSPMSSDKFQEKRVTRVVPRQDTMTLVQRALPKPLKWAAMLAIPVSLTVMLSLAGYDSLKSGSWNTANLFSSLSPFSKPENNQPAAYPATNPSPEERAVTTPTKATQHYTPPYHPVVQEEQSLATREDVVVIPSDPNVSYAVIIGAFSVENNAKKLIGKMERQGYQARLFDRSPGGLYRVTAGVHASQEEAEKMMQTMKANGFPGAWLLKK